MNYTFKILRIETSKESVDADETIQHIKYNICGTTDTSPVESATVPDTISFKDSSPQVLYSDSMTESEAETIVREKYDNDESFRTLVNDQIDTDIIENRPIKRSLYKSDFPWTDNSSE